MRNATIKDLPMPTDFCALQGTDFRALCSPPVAPGIPRMRIDAISIGYNPPDDVNVIIEVPLGGQPIKYEMDKDAGTLVVDRFLYTPMSYPGNYGFVPHTLSEDGDPIDVLVCNTRELIPGCVINVRPIGVLIMEDNAGQDEKILAVPSHRLTKRYDNVRNYTDLPEITLQQIEHFFEHYKDLEPGKWVRIGDWHGVDKARDMIRIAIDRATATNGRRPS
jgi:inorganic pyrophosphatase